MSKPSLRIPYIKLNLCAKVFHVEKKSKHNLCSEVFNIERKWKLWNNYCDELISYSTSVALSDNYPRYVTTNACATASDKYFGNEDICLSAC